MGSHCGYPEFICQGLVRILLRMAPSFYVIPFKVIVLILCSQSTRDSIVVLDQSSRFLRLRAPN